MIRRKCPYAVKPMLDCNADVDADCASGLCGRHCVTAKDAEVRECPVHGRLGAGGRFGLMEASGGPADAFVEGTTTWAVDSWEQGAARWQEELESEVTLWSRRQLDDLHEWWLRHRGGLTWDADGAAAAVEGKTAAQCATLVLLLEMCMGARPVTVGTPLQSEEDDEAEEAQEVATDGREPSSPQGVVLSEEAVDEQMLLNVEWVRAALRGYLERVIEQLMPLRVTRVLRSHVEAVVGRRNCSDGDDEDDEPRKRAKRR